MLPSRRGGAGGRFTQLRDEEEGLEDAEEITQVPAVAAAAAAAAVTPSPEGGVNIRVLDVRGQTYKLCVAPESTVLQLKELLAEQAGVEVDRQRIIHMGKFLTDTDVLSQHKVAEGSALHLFQRPKHVVPTLVSVTAEGHEGARGGGGGALPPGSVDWSYHHQPMTAAGSAAPAAGGGSGGGQHYPHIVINGGGDVMLGADWQLENARRGMRFLASFLFLTSVLQALEALAIITAAPPASEDSSYVIPPELYFILIRSILGCGVGALGVRGSHEMDSRTVKLYLRGLVVTALLAVFIRVETLVDVITGKLPEVDPYVDDDYGGGGGTRDDDPSGEGGGPDSEESELERRKDWIFNELLGTLVLGMVWFYCVVRARTYAQTILESNETTASATGGQAEAAGGGTGGGGAPPVLSSMATAVVVPSSSSGQHGQEAPLSVAQSVNGPHMI